MAKKLRDIMTENLVTCTTKDNVFEVAVKMRDENVGVIPVVDEKDHCIGMITDRDIVIRGLAEKREGSAAVEQVMSKNVIFGSPDMSVDEAARIMAQQQIRRLPVVENGRITGIVAMADLAVREQTQDEAEEALAQISKPTGVHSQGQ